LPPDTNGAAGPVHYVQIVNQEFEVFSKSGTPLYGPAPTNTLWTGFGGDCEANDDGDATVSYDRLSDRWIIQQFSVSTTPYLECIAVSATGDPTGPWYRYSFGGFGNNFPDYPKLGVWPDAYYVTYNLFAGGVSYVGPEVCAYDRAKMLLGQAATQQCRAVSNTNLGGLLPADVDSSTPPPAGSPNYVMSFGTSALKLWKFHVDWATPANSTFTGATNVAGVASFSPACGGGACIPQKGVSVKLDSLGDRLMYRLAYRNFGDHESLLVTHSVTAATTVGTRWYEIRNPNGTPTVFQQGTYAPADSNYRWMGSAAMDRNGDIALGFSISSSGIYPGIAYTARLASDPLGTMTQGETVLQAGSGSQIYYSRWGDYSSMSIDPSDDCTFWYTNEYLPSTGYFNWRTRIGSFSLPACTGAPADSFSLTANPAAVSVQQGQTGNTSIVTAVTSGSPQSVALSASGYPAGVTVSFAPNPVTAGNSSTMTIGVGSSTAAGTYPITVTGTGSSATQTTTVTLTVTAVSGSSVVTNGGFESGFSGWTVSGSPAPIIVTGSGNVHGGSQAAQLGSTTASSTGDSTLTQTVTVPSGTSTLTFWYSPRCRGSLSVNQVQVQIRNTAGTKLATVLRVCTYSTTWTPVTFDMSPYAGQTVVLWFSAHDGNKRKLGSFLLDDVSL
jgi:hypothetical protein